LLNILILLNYSEDQNYCITPIQAKGRHYRSTLEEELFIGKSESLEDLKNNPINQPEILEYKASILGGKTQCTCYEDWVDFIIEKYNYKKKSLSIGGGLGRIEKYFLDHSFTSKIDIIEICAEVNTEMRIKDPKIINLTGDLNFIVLPDNEYDFIICHGVLHHIINIEHLLSQINKALKADGIILFYEYIGCDRWSFPIETINMLRKAFPHLHFKSPKMPRGFESVRSSAILPIMNTFFGAHLDCTVSYGGIYFPFLFCADKYSKEDLWQALKLDRLSINDPKILPCYHMGVYKKTNSIMIKAPKWSDEDIKIKLPCLGFINKKKRDLKMILLKTSIGKALSNFKKNTISKFRKYQF